ncbi:MAG: PAS domain S-box protein, partial [bacterium]
MIQGDAIVCDRALLAGGTMSYESEYLGTTLRDGMKKSSPVARNTLIFRKRAEAIAAKKKAICTKALDGMSPKDVRHLVHELDVHQIELEMQNDELLRAQEELDKSRERYFDLYNLAPLSYLTLSRKGVILEVNLATATLLGMAKSKLIGRSLASFISKDGQDCYYKRRKALIETNEAQAFEVMMVRHNGTQFWVHILATMAATSTLSTEMASGDEGVSHFVMSDITDRKNLERQAESLARFPAEDPDPVLRVAPNGTLIYENDAAKSILTPWNMAVGRQIPELWSTRVAEAMRNSESASYEVDISEDTFTVNIAPVAGHGYANIYCSRITELKKAHEREKKASMLSTASRTALDTIESLEEGVALVNMDGTMRSVNPALILLTGRQRGSLEGVKLADLLPRIIGAADLNLMAASLETAMRGELPALKEMTLISTNAKRIPIIPRMTFIKDSSGKPVILVMTIQDISQYKKAERQTHIVATLLTLFTKKTSRKEYLDAVTGVIRQWSGCRCVGVRVLNDTREIAYESHVGFSEEFMQAENCLAIGRDQCVCTRVIAGHPAPQDSSCLTDGGSFRCEDAADFLKRLSPAGRKRFRGMCTESGFASIAVVPVRYHSAPLAAIHIADEKKGMISAEMASFAEKNLAPLIGEAIHRFNVEQSLRDVSEYNRNLIDASPDPFVTINARGKITGANTATEKVTGKSRSELIGTNFSTYFTDPDMAKAVYQQVFHDNVVRDYALDIRHNDGHVTPVLFNASVCRDAAGRIAEVFAAARDITERKKAQHALDIYQEQLRSLALRLTLAEEHARRELAVALHDTVGQSLALGKIKLGLLGGMLAEDKPLQMLSEIRTMFEKAVLQTRTL